MDDGITGFSRGLTRSSSIQSRVAMLDIFLMAFGTAALAFFTFSLKERTSPRRAFILATLSGVCLGLASALLQAVGRVPVGGDRRDLRPDRPDAPVAHALRRNRT